MTKTLQAHSNRFVRQSDWEPQFNWRYAKQLIVIHHFKDEESQCKI